MIPDNTRVRAATDDDGESDHRPFDAEFLRLAGFLFAGPYLNVFGRSHDIAPDGRHLLIAGPTAETTTTLTMVTNWVTRLPRPGGTR